MKKYLVWLISIVAVLIFVAGYFYVRTEREKFQKSQESITAPAEKPAAEAGEGRRGRTGTETRVEIFLDGKSLRVLTQADLEKLPKDPPPVISRRVREGWVLGKVLPELKNQRLDRLAVSYFEGESREFSAKEIRDKQNIFFLSPNRRGGISLVPIDLRETHVIPAGRKAKGLKKLVLKDITRLEIFTRGARAAANAPQAVTAPAAGGPFGGGGIGRGDGRGGQGRPEGWEGRGQGKGQGPGQLQSGGGGRGGGQGRGPNGGGGQGRGRGQGSGQGRGPGQGE